MKRILGLLFYSAILGIMSYAGVQLYRPTVVVRAGSSCCMSDPDCGAHDICQSCGPGCCGIDGKNCGSIGIIQP
jgi:hypothetical protein